MKPGRAPKKLIQALLMTHLPALPAGRQAQAWISKEDYTDCLRFLASFRNLQEIPVLTITSQSSNLNLVKEKHSSSINIKVNEKEVSVPSKTTLHQLKERFNPKADVIIYNGFALTSDHPLTAGD